MIASTRISARNASTSVGLPAHVARVNQPADGVRGSSLVAGAPPDIVYQVGPPGAENEPFHQFPLRPVVSDTSGSLQENLRQPVNVDQRFQLARVALDEGLEVVEGLRFVLRFFYRLGHWLREAPLQELEVRRTSVDFVSGHS